MRDRALAEALQRLAADAAAALTAQITAGEQIPFDVAEDDGDGSLFYRYVPLTSRFVRDREDELRLLPSFREAIDAVTTADVAVSYLDAHGEPVPEEEDERSAKMLITFLARMWDGCAEIAVDRARLEAELRRLDALTRDLQGSDLLVAPLIGLQMSLARLDLPGGVRIARAADVDTPLEARHHIGMERAPWEPQFVALAEIDEEAEGPFAALGQLRQLISVLRLFRSGAVGLGPYAFAPTGEDQWQRFPTGSPPPRSGGYELDAAAAQELRSLAERLEARPDPQGALAWAIGRFEMGCSREDALEGLTDHVLALRAALGGSGHMKASLAVRTAALAGREGGDDLIARLDHAIALELALSAGAGPAMDRGDAIGAALWLEDVLRGILRDGALGLHGLDVSAAADEILVARGLQAGEPRSLLDEVAQDLPDPSRSEEEQMTTPGNFRREDEWSRREDEWREPEPSAGEDESRTHLLEPVPGEDEIRITARRGEPVAPEGDDLYEEYEDLKRAMPERPARADRFAGGESAADEASGEKDWFSEAPGSGATLEWPAAEITRREPEREPIDTPRVRHLFPVPEDSEDWSVPELDYRRRSSGGR